MNNPNSVLARKKVPLKTASSSRSLADRKRRSPRTPTDPPAAPADGQDLTDSGTDGVIVGSERKEQLAHEQDELEQKKLLAMSQLQDEMDTGEEGEGTGTSQVEGEEQDQEAIDAELTDFPALVRHDTNDFSVASSSYYTWDNDTEGNPLRRRRKNTFSDEEIKNIPRLVHRNMPFKQSKQELAVVNRTIFTSLKLQRILSQDWYHVFLRMNTLTSLSLLLGLWTFSIIMFGLIYMKIDSAKPNTECGLGAEGTPIEFNPAFAFSLETCTTVGYGLPNGVNSFFESECKSLQIAIFFQMMWSMLFNAFLFAFLFARLARCEARGAQVLFSDKAIIEIRDGKWMMHVRIYDFDAAAPLVEAHVRMYCVSWRDYERQTRDLVQPHLLHHMRILQPDDELGATLYTSIPANVSHRIDAFSPLAPLKLRRKMKYLANGGVPLREADQENGNRSGVMCPVCGEVFGTIDHLRRHVQYQQMVETQDEYPIQGSHRDTNLIKPNLFKPFVLTEDQIREQLRDKEIMVVVEGIEPMVSGTFQALQSYKLNNIVFGGRFEPCMSQQAGKIYVDVDKFHKILPPDDNSMHRYSKFNGGRYHPQISQLPNFFGNDSMND